MKEQLADGDYTMYKKRKIYDKVDRGHLYAVKYDHDRYKNVYTMEDAEKCAKELLEQGFKKVTIYFQEEVTTMRSWRLTKK